MAEARQLFNQGIDAADRAGDLSLYAIGWNRLGEEYLKRGELARAEAPLLEAYRDSQAESSGAGRFVSQPGAFAVGAGRPHVGRGAARPRGGTFRAGPGRDSDVGHLSLPRTRPDGAGAPARCHGGPANRGPPGARLAVERAARRCLADGDRGLAGTGPFGAGRGRQPALPGDRRSGADPRDLRGGRGKPRRQSARGAFAWTHARSFRIAGRLLGNPGAAATRRGAGPAHARTHTARKRSPESAPNWCAWRWRWGRHVAPLPSSLLERTRQALDDDSALLSFQLGDQISWLWALDREGLALYALPARAEVESQAQAAATGHPGGWGCGRGRAGAVVANPVRTAGAAVSAQNPLAGGAGPRLDADAIRRAASRPADSLSRPRWRRCPTPVANRRPTWPSAT